MKDYLKFSYNEFCETLNEWNLPEEPAIKLALIRSNYCGGFCDVNRTHQNKFFTDPDFPKFPTAKEVILKRVYSYDLNSAYPAVVQAELLPVSFYEDDGLQFVDNLIYIVLDRPLESVSNLRPLFQTATTVTMTKANHPKRFEKGSQFILWGSEFNTIKNLYKGWPKEIKTKAVYGLKIDAGGYVDYFYKMKKESKGKNQAFYLLAKIFMNALTGKFGQRPEFEDEVFFSNCNSVSWWTGKEQKERDLRQTNNKSFYVQKKYLTALENDNWNNFLIVSKITSRTREKIFQAIQHVGVENWIYSDTDSIKILKELDNKKLVGSELGQYEHEGTYETSIYYRPKTYWYSENNKSVWRFAGVSQQFTENINPNYLEDSQWIEHAKLKPISIKGGIKLIIEGEFFEMEND